MSIWNISSCAKDIIRENHEKQDIISVYELLTHDISDISGPLPYFVRKNNVKHDIVSVHELLTHDGHNIDGPESDIYDLFVIVKNNNMSGIYDYYHYHRENWFNCDKEDKMYYLEDKQRTCDLVKINNLNDYSKIIFF
jgi:hypothetical protein